MLEKGSLKNRDLKMCPTRQSLLIICAHFLGMSCRFSTGLNLTRQPSATDITVYNSRPSLQLVDHRPATTNGEKEGKCGRPEEMVILILNACSQYLLGLPLRMSGKHRTQSDHARLELLSRET